jgi:alpha-beta hydrolase superfamily lysophospholipase
MPDYDLIEQNESAAGIPTLTAAQKGLPLDAPRVIVLHGLFGHKEKYLEELLLLARKGLRATAIDLALHGERGEGESGARYIEANLAAALRHIIFQTAADISSLIDSWGDDSRVGLYGVSAGGFASHAALMRDPRIKALAAVISSPDWTTIDADHAPAAGTDEWIELLALSPVSYPEAYPPRAVLLLNGTSDLVVSSAGSELLHERLAPLYAAQGLSGRLKLELYPDIGHEVLPVMRTHGIDWLAAHLAAG